MNDAVASDLSVIDPAASRSSVDEHIALPVGVDGSGIARPCWRGQIGSGFKFQSDGIPDRAAGEEGKGRSTSGDSDRSTEMRGVSRHIIANDVSREGASVGAVCSSISSRRCLREINVSGLRFRAPQG